MGKSGKGGKSFNQKGFWAWKDANVSSGTAKRLLREGWYPEGIVAQHGSPPSKGGSKGPAPPREPPPPEVTGWIDYGQKSSGWQDSQGTPVWTNTWRGWETTTTRWASPYEQSHEWTEDFGQPSSSW